MCVFLPFLPKHHCLPAWLCWPEYRISQVTNIWDKLITLNSGFFYNWVIFLLLVGYWVFAGQIDPALKSMKALSEKVLLDLVLSVSLHFIFVLSFKNMRVIMIIWEEFLAITFFSPLTICWHLELQQWPEQQKKGKNNVGEEQSKERFIVLKADNMGGSPAECRIACGVQVWDTSIIFFLAWDIVSNQ